MTRDLRGALESRRASLKRAVGRHASTIAAFLRSRSASLDDAKSSRPVWLFGGSSGRKYADNSAALFRYIVKNHPEVDARWVISRFSDDAARAAADGTVAYAEDPDTYLLGMTSQVQVISHGVHDVPTCASALARAFKVRLGHGITALVKRKPPGPFGFDSLDRVFDLVPVSSEFEKRNKLEWGFSPKKLVVTGLARYDDLLEKNRMLQRATSPTEILYMPTARDWLVGTRSIENSNYHQKIVDFLLHSGTKVALKAHNARLLLYVHPLMWDHFHGILKAFSGDGVSILPLNADLQEALVRASLFITDYSSVAWDALYIGRPTMFFQFDHDEYFLHRGKGSHVDFSSGLFGPVAREPLTAAALVRAYLESGFDALGYECEMRRWQQRAFVAVDANNCQRITQHILAGVRGRGASVAGHASQMRTGRA